MVQFSFMIAQAAIQLALILISELKDASPLLADLIDTQSVKLAPIWIDETIDPLGRDSIGSTESYKELDFSFDSLLKGYLKYGHAMESLHETCEPFVRLNRKNIEKYGKDSSIEVIRDETSGKQIIVEADSKDSLGEFLYPFNDHCMRRKRKNEDPSTMGFEFFEFAGGKMVFINSNGLKIRYFFGASFAELERIMKHQDPFENLANLENRKVLKIEYALEDKINGKFSILYSEYSQTATKRNFSSGFINGKAMGYFAFSIDKSTPGQQSSLHKNFRSKGLLSQPLISKTSLFLRWNSQTERYDLEKLDP